MSRPSPLEAVSDSLVMARRGLTQTLRKPALLVFTFVEPVILILIFRYAFGGAIRTPNGSYVDYLIPGILVLTAIFGAIVTGIGLSEDLSRGIVDRLRSLPIARSAVLVGRTVSDLARNVGSVILIFGVGFLVGFRPSESIPRVLAAIALLLAFAYVFSWIAATIGLLVRDPETAQGAGFVWVFPLTFVSSAFVPTDTMPSAVRAFADVNPVTLCVDAVRALTIGGHAAGPVLGTLAWLAGLLLVFVPFAVSRYRALE
ncbi:MAG TPA: ABC transporter permease [Thermoleophilaceae bacterium]|jgi:ABC-2 type transport system permease protein/oleandomycin transport system permease protein|nr:ABC transporter permease [Thermoleophilaceae bacterium]